MSLSVQVCDIPPIKVATHCSGNGGGGGGGYGKIVNGSRTQFV